MAPTVGRLCVWRVVATLSLALLANCGGGGGGVQTKISPNAVPLTHAVAQQATVEPSSLVFPKTGNGDLANLQAGAVLTSDFGYGFLRKVMSVDSSGDSINIQTEQATLLDVVDEGESEATIDFSTISPDVWRTWKGVRQTSGGAGFEIPLNGEVIWENEALGASVRITSGRLTFMPKLDVGITIKGGLAFRAIESGNLKAELHVEANCSQSITPQTFEVTLWESPKFRLPMPAIGPVGIVLDARLFVKAGVEIRANGEITLTAGTVADVNAQYGVTYDGSSGWQYVHSFDNSWSPDMPEVTTSAELHSLAYISGGAELGFFGGLNLGLVKLGASGNVAVTVEPYLQFDYASSDAPPWALKAGFRGKYWASLKVLSATVADVQPTVFFDTGTQIAPSTDSSAPPMFAATCGDAVESDCGGTCTPCAIGKGCLVNQDCQSNSCLDGTCAQQVPTHCIDGQQDADETEIDCGGSCLSCFGTTCTGASDCASGNCEKVDGASTCGIPETCSNRVLDEGETDIDCGGVCAPVLLCGDGQKCLTAADCQGGACDPTTATCASLPESCMDGVQDGEESDIDCGGGVCRKCRSGKICKVNGDCQSGTCSNGMCQ